MYTVSFKVKFKVWVWAHIIKKQKKSIDNKDKSLFAVLFQRISTHMVATNMNVSSLGNI